MAREKELFRDNLQVLNEHFPNKFLLTACEVAEFTGLERHTVKKKFTFKENERYITKTELARQLS